MDVNLREIKEDINTCQVEMKANQAKTDTNLNDIKSHSPREVYDDNESVRTASVV
jgi:hypothetical protein